MPYIKAKKAATPPAPAYPLFFNGPTRMLIVMATSVWGPMRICEIMKLAGRRTPNDRTGHAARDLEAMRLVVIERKHGSSAVVGLDRRHPAHDEVQRFGKALYELYLSPHIAWAPSGGRDPISPTSPKYDTETLDMHVLGPGFRFQMLHLLAEVDSCPAYVLLRSLGASHDSYSTIRNFEHYGVVKKLSAGKSIGKTTYAVRLDQSWPAHAALLDLLRRLNESLSEYGDLAEAYRDERSRGHHAHRWKRTYSQLTALLDANRIAHVQDERRRRSSVLSARLASPEIQ